MSRDIGRFYETKAENFLKQNDCRLVEKNYSCRFGEIDLIMENKKELLFIEVRYRNNSQHGEAFETVNTQKQKKLIQTAEIYLQKHPKYRKHHCRFDVISITGPDENLHTDWIKDAFQC